MEFKSVVLKAGELGVTLASVAVLVLAGCGGGSSPAGDNTPVSVTVVPFKGMFANGAVILRDANGEVVPLVSGGAINAAGVAELSFGSKVAYPLIVEVSGSYYNENSGQLEAGALPLRGIIVGAHSVDAGSAVPVTLVTETAVANLQHRLGASGSGGPVRAASAVAALQEAGYMLGVPATAIPRFDSATHQTDDPDTLRLAALAVVAGNQEPGATLIEQARALAGRFAALNSASAPAEVVSQADFDAALAAVTSATSGIMPAGATPPASSHIGPLSMDFIALVCQLLQEAGNLPLGEPAGGGQMAENRVSGLVHAGDVLGSAPANGGRNVKTGVRIRSMDVTSTPVNTTITLPSATIDISGVIQSPPESTSGSMFPMPGPGPVITGITVSSVELNWICSL